VSARGHPLPSLAAVRAAAERIRPHAHRTPVFTSSGLDALTGARLFFKCENMQRAGAFKFRGACNTVLSLSEGELRRGVATHSSGNHGAALALAARIRGARAVVVMPADASPAKRAAAAAYGAEIVDCGGDLESRERTLREVLAESGAVPVHPYDDARVVAGQGTAALELVEDVPELDAIVVPVGGGGLIAGTALGAMAAGARVVVVGAEPAAVDDAYRSLRAGRRLADEGRATIADGLRATVGELTFPLIRAHVDAIIPVSEAGIVRAMRLVWERLKLVVEPSAAVPVAALLDTGLGPRARRIGVILSGGNADLDGLPWGAGNVLPPGAPPNA